MLTDVVACIVTGVAHTGTTVITDVLRNHPKLDSGFECGFLLAGRPAEFLNLPIYFSEFKKWWQMDDPLLTEEILKSENFEEMYTKARDLSPEIVDKNSLIVDKTPAYIHHLKIILDRAPLVPVFVIKRNPLDTYFIWKKSNHGINEFISTYNQAYTLLDKCLNDPAYKDRIHPVRFEEVMLNPKKEFEKIFAILNLEFDRNFLKRPFRYSNNNHISPKFVAEYRSELTREEIQTLKGKIPKKRFYNFSRISACSSFFRRIPTFISHNMRHILRTMRFFLSIKIHRELYYHNRQVKGLSTLDLKAELREKYPELKFAGMSFVGVKLIAKSMGGEGVVDLLPGKYVASRKTVGGEATQFSSAEPDTFHSVWLVNSTGDESDNWRLKFRGNFVVRKVFVYLKATNVLST